MDNIYISRDENGNYIKHHGVKGQKWYRRRYQNEDGSLTAAGRKHYGYGKEYRRDLKTAKKDEKFKIRNEYPGYSSDWTKKAIKRGVIGTVLAGPLGLGIGVAGTTRSLAKQKAKARVNEEWSKKSAAELIANSKTVQRQKQRDAKRADRAIKKDIKELDKRQKAREKDKDKKVNPEYTKKYIELLDKHAKQHDGDSSHLYFTEKDWKELDKIKFIKK